MVKRNRNSAVLIQSGEKTEYEGSQSCDAEDPVVFDIPAEKCETYENKRRRIYDIQDRGSHGDDFVQADI